MISIARRLPRIGAKLRGRVLGARAWAGLAALLLVGAPAAAQVTATLQSPAAPVTAGATLEVVLLVTNAGELPAAVEAPAELPLVSSLPNGPGSVVLQRVPGEPPAVNVRAGGFVPVRYRAVVPPEARGLGVLAARDAAFGRIAVEVQPASAASPAPVAPTGTTAVRDADGAASPALERRRPLGVLAYEPVYFSLGFNRVVNARFQLSLKLRPFGPPDERIDLPGSLLGNLYGGFTQTSLWDLESDSKPFFDSSYKPTVLYQRHDSGRSLFGARLGYAAGFEHESNGQGGAASRSMNLLVFRPTLRWVLADDWTAVFSPKLYAYVEKSENADIADYRGYGDYLLSVEKADSWKWAATLRVGTAGKGSLLLDSSYPLRHIVGDHISTGWGQGFLHLQYFNGYGESLRTYRVRTPWQLRIGYMLVR